jgi:tellurite methyltransferase
MAEHRMILKELGQRIRQRREKLDMKQNDLALALQVSPQAVSKWERGENAPDIIIFVRLAAILNVSVDWLLGRAVEERLLLKNIYDEKYDQDSYYWGIQPSSSCLEVIKRMPAARHIKVLDLGCGEGRNAVFFARHGYDVSAFDSSAKGVQKTQKLAEKAAVKINVFQDDINDFRLNEKFDVIFAVGVLHYIRPEVRADVFQNYKNFTNPNGLNVFSVFVKKPFIAKAPDAEKTSQKWLSGELFTYYHDWRIEHCTEGVFDCTSSGVAHKHAANKMIARNSS